jgi:hypothetical protein
MNTDHQRQSEREANLVFDTSGLLDRAVQEDLQRIRAESLLARQDSAQELTRALDASLAEPLVLSEITSHLDRLEGQTVPSYAELENLLAAPETRDLSMERNLLAQLMSEGGDTQGILKKGFVFLKHRRFAEALEWWTLHRQSLDPSSSRLSLLLLVMETLTHLWSGHAERAAAVRCQVTAHPLFPKHRLGPMGEGRGPRGSGS